LFAPGGCPEICIEVHYFISARITAMRQLYYIIYVSAVEISATKRDAFVVGAVALASTDA